MSHTSSVALKKRSGIRRPLPWVTRERAASVGGSPRWAITRVFCGADAPGAAPDPVGAGLVPGVQPITTNPIERNNIVVTRLLRTLAPPTSGRRATWVDAPPPRHHRLPRSSCSALLRSKRPLRGEFLRPPLPFVDPGLGADGV